MANGSLLRKRFLAVLIPLVAWVVSGMAVGWLSATGRSVVGLAIGLAVFGLLGLATCSLAYEALRALNDCQLRLDQVTITDPLTGLLNRASILERLEAELNRGWRSGESVSCAFLDVDGLRKINEQFGLAAGDSVLRSLGNMIAECCRQYDTAGRYGGEEFLLVLPATELDNAARAAERLRRRIESSEFACHGQGFRVTVTLGVTQADPNVQEATDAVVARANEAAGRAKTEGANRVSASATLAFVERAANPGPAASSH